MKGPRVQGALGVLLEAAPVVAVGCLVFLLIRTHLLEYYRIPSKSMAPTLHGDPKNGDLVLVDKTAFWFKQPKPFDMVVVRARPEHAGHSGAGHIVKRMVALGPASVTIQDGDLFVGSVEGGAGERVVKNPATHADMRVPVFRFPTPGGGEAFTDFFQVPPGLGGLQDVGTAPDSHQHHAAHVVLRAGAANLSSLAAALDPSESRHRLKVGELDAHLPGHMGTRKAVDTSYLDPDGRRQAADQPGFQPDIGMSLRFVANAGVEGFQAVMEQRRATVAMAYEVTGSGRLMVNGSLSGEAFSGPKLHAGEATEVTFGYLDGHCFLIVAGELVLHRELALPRVRELPGSRTWGPENGLSFGVAGEGGEVEIGNLVVFHDVHYLEDQSRTLRRGGNVPYIVPKGCMFLLGDNTRDSQDSREFETDNFRLVDLVGRPVAILAPRSRSRVLCR